jgi:hypothetical protein
VGSAENRLDLQFFACLLTAALLLGAAPARAQEPPAVGISDQSWTTLVDPLLGWLGVRQARVIAPWDVALHRSADLDGWLAWAAAKGIDPLVSLGRRPGEDCRGGPCGLPSRAAYRDAFAAFHARWPEATAVSVWNEANHPVQPTAAHPEAVAGYYEAAREICPGCRLLAAEVVDIPGMTSWLERFQTALGYRPRLWGLQNYGDVTRLRDSATSAMLAAVDGDVWITETGGLVHFALPDGTVRWPEDEERARASMQYALRLADADAARVRRVYVYNWREGPGRRWDSGLISPGGRLRPSFWALAAHLRPDAAAAPPPAAGPAPRAAPPARVARRPHMDRRGRVRARVACPRAAADRCSALMVVRTHARSPRRGPRELGRAVRTLAPGGERRLRVRLSRSRLRLIRAGRTHSVLADLWLGGDRPLRYRVRCVRPR